MNVRFCSPVLMVFVRIPMDLISATANLDSQATTAIWSLMNAFLARVAMVVVVSIRLMAMNVSVSQVSLELIVIQILMSAQVPLVRIMQHATMALQTSPVNACLALLISCALLILMNVR